MNVTQACVRLAAETDPAHVARLLFVVQREIVEAAGRHRPYRLARLGLALDAIVREAYAPAGAARFIPLAMLEGETFGELAAIARGELERLRASGESTPDADRAFVAFATFADAMAAWNAAQAAPRRIPA